MFLLQTAKINLKTVKVYFILRTTLTMGFGEVGLSELGGYQ